MGTWFWIILAILAILLFATGKTKNNGKSSGRTGNSTHRIDHLHYIDRDEYECPKCHTRFRKNVMVCPKCGLRFTGARKDRTDYDDELEEELDMDDWEEEDN